MFFIVLFTHTERAICGMEHYNLVYNLGDVSEIECTGSEQGSGSETAAVVDARERNVARFCGVHWRRPIG